VISNAPIEFSPLRIGQRDLSAIRNDAVPNLLDERKSFLDTETINSECFYGDRHE
jgi:hypothetical protein